MKNIALINKPICLTPLQAVELFKEQNSQYRNSKISYAGRLDPMAEGLLLLLIDEENKRRKDYESLEKIYEFSMLLGISTDTYDLMGRITAISNQQVAINTKELKKHLLSLQGRKMLPYPPYSSRTVKGIPLYKYARENRLDEISIPQRKVIITSFELLSPSLFPYPELLAYISRVIPKVQGDFRQDEIVKLWHESTSLFPAMIPKINFRITCSSGTYVRGIVHELGKKLGFPTVTFSIKRTRIGEFHLKDALGLKKLPVVQG